MNYVYPGNFSIPQAVALGHLVDAAYNQYTQFQAGQAWVPPAGYNIVATFDAQEPWKVGLLDLVHFFPIPTPTVPFGFVATNGPDTFIVIRGVPGDRFSMGTDNAGVQVALRFPHAADYGGIDHH